MTINAAGTALIKFYESCRLTAYLCEAGIPTIGWGHTAGVTMDDVRNGRTITQAEAEALFEQDLANFEGQVSKLLKRAATPNQLGALVSLTYNIGAGNLANSSVLKFHNLGNLTGAALSFPLWDKYKDPKTGILQVSNGLLARRQKEAALYALA